MLNVIVTYMVMVILLLLPFVVVLQTLTSERTRSHLWALLLHDIIKWCLKMSIHLIVGVFRLVWKMIALIISEFMRLFRP